MEMTSAVASLAALAHEGRLAAFRSLVQAGGAGLAAGELARRLEVLPNTLSTNLGILAQAGLVTSQREGRSIIYAASFDTMTGLIDYLTRHCCAGDPAACGIAPPTAAARKETA